MKKFIAFVAIASLAFSACNGSYTIAKRKYNKGFYVSKSSGNSTKPNETKSTVAKVTASEEKIETVVVPKTLAEEKVQPIEIAAVKPFAKPSMENGTKATNVHKPVASTAKNNYAPAVEIKPVKIDSNKAANVAKKGDTNIIILVILCFLWWLNLIAVYLHDGGINLNFWITLLLDFTVIGGIIFSLLVVLDIIDLS